MTTHMTWLGFKPPMVNHLSTSRVGVLQYFRNSILKMDIQIFDDKNPRVITEKLFAE